MAENPNAEIAYLPEAAPFHNEGKTVASWVAMAGVTLGAVVAAVAVALASLWLFVAGFGVIALALVVGLVLRNMGYGQPTPGTGKTPKKSRS
ncbi:hypothetical protein DNL40_11295 [Xylanimonas oleitrophica]|uniref:Uncharacterized protein n=1 Tax=Xylanimonas oleitrophica TaxID=2607479 RepID=A0A2W5WNY1_9MICO|nr:HGxxPAAW family protein [Xylanimonas oleitrophica]PZR52473.1 hypothetical protein DNL40_11295 [Xylanimonas oleitrophica]